MNRRHLSILLFSLFISISFGKEIKLTKSIVSQEFRAPFVEIENLLKNEKLQLAIKLSDKVLNDVNINKPVDIKVFSYFKATAFYKDNNSKEALKILNKIKLIDTPNKPKLDERIFSILGSIHTRHSQFDEALKNYLNALSLNNLLKDSIGYSQNLNDIGLMYYYNGYNTKAFEYLEKALKMKENFSTKGDYFKTKMNLALILIDLERGKEAVSYIQEYLSFIKSNGSDKKSIIICNYNLGLAFFLDKMNDSSMYYLNTAMNLAKKENFKYAIAKINYALSEVYFEKGDYNKSFKTSSEAIDFKFNAVEFWGYTNLILAHSMYKLNHNDYFNKFQIVIDSLKSNPNLSLEKELNNKLLLIALDKKDFENAYKYEKRINQINEELKSNNLNIQISELKIHTELEDKEAKLKEMDLRNQLAEANITKKSNLIIILVAFVAILLILFVFIFFQNQRINKINYKLQESNNTIIKFFSIIAHDLRSPIGTFKMILDELNTNYNDFDDEERKKLINETSKEANNINKLLENLLTWARSTKGEFQLTFNNTNISNELDEIITTNENKLHDKNITIHKNYNNNIIAKVDKDIFNTIIRNIISNSIKFSPINGNIMISGSQNSNKTTIIINDDGIGMSSDHIDDLFKIDKKVTRIGTKQEKGTGLGLIIVKELIDLMGGKINIQSEQNTGTSVSITFPNK